MSATRSYRPCAIVAHHDASGAAETERRLRRLGWNVYLAHDGMEVRRLVFLLGPALVLLGVELHDESGWLTCAKLSADWPDGRIILMGEATTKNEARANMVGAEGIVASADDLAALLRTPARVA